MNESAITRERARDPGIGRRPLRAVTGGTMILRLAGGPGDLQSRETFLDRMIAMVEGAKRKKTPLRSP